MKYGIDFAKPGGDEMVKSYWRVVRDKEYFCWAIQRRRRFLFLTWWTSEYMSDSKEMAETFIKHKLWRL